MINLYSDNVAPIPPESMAALQEANLQSGMPYGADAATERATEAVCEAFERRLAVIPVPTGTAANALSMSLLCRPYGAVFATECAHIQTSEGGATEFFTGGAKIVTLPASDGRMLAATLDEAIGRAGKGLRFRSQPDAISMTNGTELGTVYPRPEVEALAAVARRHGLKVHMDGARFANALARLACSPADLTWRAGVDVLSLGMTKNGAMGVEVVVCFDESLADEAAHRARRCGFTFSKMRFATAQVVAALKDGLWLRRAADANAAAQKIAEGLSALQEVSILHPVEINHIFLRVPVEVAEALPAHGLQIGHRGGGRDPARDVVGDRRENDCRRGSGFQERNPRPVVTQPRTAIPVPHARAWRGNGSAASASASVPDRSENRAGRRAPAPRPRRACPGCRRRSAAAQRHCPR